jgi:hypothetical protein
MVWFHENKIFKIDSSFITMTVRADEERHYTTKEVISVFSLSTFHLYVAALQKHLHME